MKNTMFYHLIIFVSFVNDCENHWCSWSYCSFTFVFPKGFIKVTEHIVLTVDTSSCRTKWIRPPPPGSRKNEACVVW